MKSTTTTSKKESMVRLNVGGQRYDVPKSLFDLYPSSMLSRLVSKEWGHDDDNIIFIDRNGYRFQYVLDFMRDQEVNLPMTESIEATKRELEYYGLEGVRGEEETSSPSLSPSPAPSITLGTPAEAGNILAAMIANKKGELESLDKTIKECTKMQEKCETHKNIVKLAHSLFEYSLAFCDRGKNEEFTINIREEDERRSCSSIFDGRYSDEEYDNDAENLLREKLTSYGLELVYYTVTRYYSCDDPSQFILKFIKSPVPVKDIGTKSTNFDQRNEREGSGGGGSALPTHLNDSLSTSRYEERGVGGGDRDRDHYRDRDRDRGGDDRSSSRRRKTRSRSPPPRRKRRRRIQW
ncbi:hypothetical protein FRACYDRAFT_238795 [Fragilariopsis cylindrus CCMP1102]|uniref:BTB domain-containing protein n=1 Tax=Fragilariopsis cylindrus CCMP1102 TaxID=635003 RepID=A0A1E7FDK7_9STRA|nr:hypothetical protein FRACYDRAFT_238795 [Fragilariopsis cylindrus CCMP1102]|eukprot:OEU16206.1 hypothetical protein FRACYDRAFT_238795 [Fragilariopsis cylindrus CCMP1102]